MSFTRSIRFLAPAAALAAAACSDINSGPQTKSVAAAAVIADHRPFNIL